MSTMMHAYVSKKLSIPTEQQLHSIACNNLENWIACGGDSGIIKIIQLCDESDTNTSSKPLDKSSSSISSNYTLKGHAGSISCLAWNQPYCKLASADTKGLIIVWAFKDEQWYQEMNNRREESYVTDLKWSSCGGKQICIAYNDGAVMVGSVEGSRIWGKDLGFSPKSLEWSPDARNILFVTEDTNEFKMYENVGNEVKDMSIVRCDGDSSSIVCIDWFDCQYGYVAANLAVAFTNGVVQLMQGIHDMHPLSFDTRMTIRLCRWSPNGIFLAVCGDVYIDEKRCNTIAFYNSRGCFLYQLKVPGADSIYGLTWERSCLRVALAVGSSLYFARIKPQHKWATLGLGTTLVYAASSQDVSGVEVIFMNQQNRKENKKYFDDVSYIDGKGDYCLIITTSMDRKSQNVSSFRLILCDSIGTTIATKMLKFSPDHIAMTSSTIAIADCQNVYIWRFGRSSGCTNNDTSAVDISNAIQQKVSDTEWMFHIDDNSKHPAKALNNYSIQTSSSSNNNNKIMTICMSGSILIASREHGRLDFYSLLPEITLLARIAISCVPVLMQLNCDASKVGIIDIDSVFRIVHYKCDMEKVSLISDVVGRKNAWHIKWSDDDPDSCAIMEKGRLFIFEQNSVVYQIGVSTNGYILTFKDLEVNMVMLDTIVSSGANLGTMKLTETFETKRLQEAKQFLENPRGEHFVYFQQEKHPVLWRLLGVYALQKLDFKLAEEAFYQLKDYMGIVFSQTVPLRYKNKQRQMAEVCRFVKSYDDAESYYLKQDLTNDAYGMRKSAGQWRCASGVVYEARGIDEGSLQEAWYEVANDCVEEKHWSVATKYYLKAKHFEEAVNSSCLAQELDTIKQLIDANKSDMSVSIARKLDKKFHQLGLNI